MKYIISAPYGFIKIDKSNEDDWLHTNNNRTSGATLFKNKETAKKWIRKIRSWYKQRCGSSKGTMLLFVED